MFVNYFSGLKHQNLEYISVCLIGPGFKTSKLSFRVNYDPKTKVRPDPKKSRKPGVEIRPWSNQKFRYLDPGLPIANLRHEIILINIRLNTLM